MNETQFFDLLKGVLHGDEEHRDWLTEAFHAAWNGQPIPPPRGSGTKDRLYMELLDTQRKLTSALAELEELRNPADK